MGLSLKISAGPRQHSHSWVRVPRDSWPYFTPQIRDSPNLECQVPVLITPGIGWPSFTPRHWVTFSSLPTTRRATVEVFEPASHCTILTNCPAYNIWHRSHIKHRSSVAVSIVACAAIGADRAENADFQPARSRVIRNCCSTTGAVYRAVT
jgi:hypothetical protein